MKTTLSCCLNRCNITCFPAGKSLSGEEMLRSNDKDKLATEQQGIKVWKSWSYTLLRWNILWQTWVMGGRGGVQIGNSPFLYASCQTSHVDVTCGWRVSENCNVFSWCEMKKSVLECLSYTTGRKQLKNISQAWPLLTNTYSDIQPSISASLTHQNPHIHSLHTNKQSHINTLWDQTDGSRAGLDKQSILLIEFCRKHLLRSKRQTNHQNINYSHLTYHLA